MTKESLIESDAPDRAASDAANNDEIEMIMVPKRPTKEMIEAAWAGALAEDAAGVRKAMIECWLEQRKLGQG